MNKYLILITFLFLANCAHRITPEQKKNDVLTTLPFSTSSELSWLKEAVAVANCVFTKETFFKEIESFPRFTHANGLSPKEVAQEVRKSKSVKIEIFRPKYPLSKMVATTFNDKPDTVFLNKYKHPREIRSLVNTLMHERLHWMGFSHDGNPSVGKQDSANYRVGTIAEKFVEECK